MKHNKKRKTGRVLLTVVLLFLLAGTVLIVFADSGRKQTDGKNVYTVYISGIDNRGELIEKSRSDVNIIAVANADTKQLLLVSTPRDYFVPLSISDGVPDKLTHAGMYGVEVSMDTLGMLYDMDISKYIRVNFQGFEDIIDALGGITVYSDYEFNSQNETGYYFKQGENELNGEEALIFARERYSFAEGDRQRGKNQMEVIKGVMNKAFSAEMITKLPSVLSALNGAYETNFSFTEITGLLLKLAGGSEGWNVVSYSVDGTGDTQKPYSMSENAYVMIPDMETVEKAKTLMQKVKDGEILSEEDAASGSGTAE